MVYIHKKIYNYYMLLLMRVKQTDIISITTKPCEAYVCQ